VNAMGSRDEIDFLAQVFNGEGGDDVVRYLNSGTFNGGPGDDSVTENNGGRFLPGPDD